MKKKKSTKGKPNISSKKAIGKEEVNPFELKINRQRHSVLGRKLKNDKGKPGVSRSKAMKRRAEIFTKSSLLIKKSNAFIDKRIGEYDGELSKEDAVIERMAQARRKRFKKDIFNLNDEEPLTHYGQPLEEMEKFDAPDKDSEDDDEDDMQLNADFVDKVHFGGFLTKKTEDGDAQKSHKEILGDLILESKKRKEEKKVERELTEDLTEKLDKEWKEIHSLMSDLRRKDSEDHPQKDPYDITVKELKFEPRAPPSALVKSEEEVKKAEELRIKKLEEERLNRMKADNSHKTNIEENLSADSIYDGLEIDDMIQAESVVHTGEVDENENRADSDDNDESGSDDEVSHPGSEASDIADFSSEDEGCINEPDIVDQRNIELSTSVEVPQNVDQFMDLVSGKSGEEVSSIISSIIKCNHPSHMAEGKKKLDLFFFILLKYVSKVSQKGELEHLDVLTPHLFSLTQINGLRTGLIFKKYLTKKISDYEKAKCLKVFPLLDTLIALKLAAILYPTSDYHHPIITPAMLMMSDILCSPFKVTWKNVLSRLFVSCLFFEYVSFSKRLAVEAVVFLESVLSMASREHVSCCSAKKKLHKVKKLLVIDSAIETEPVAISLRLAHHESKFEDSISQRKVSVLFCTVAQLLKFAKLYSDLPSFRELFCCIENLCDTLPLDKYPSKLSEAVKDLRDFIRNRNGSRIFVAFPKKKPKMLKMFEPKFELSADDKNMTLNKKIRLEKRLSQKIKKEEKSILREVRRDAQFIARKQIEERREADEERKRKVKQIYQDISIQQGEYKKFAKKK